MTLKGVKCWNGCLFKFLVGVRVFGVASHWRMLQISTYQIKMVYEKTPKVRKVQHFVWNQQYSHAKPGSDGGGWGGGLVVVWCGAALILEKWFWVTCVTLVLGPVTICCKIKSSTIRHKELLMMLHIENWIETHWSIKWKNAHIEVVQFLLVKSKEQLTHEGYHAKNLGNKKNLGNRNR